MGIFYIVLYVLAAMQLVHSYDLLPDTMATHFGADGQANRFMSLPHFAQFHMAFVVLLSGLFYLTGWAVSKVPARYLSIPNKDYWLAPARAADSMKRLRNDISLMGLFAGAFAMAIDGLVIDVNAGEGRTLDPASLQHIMTAAAVVMAGYMLYLLRRFRLPPGANTGTAGDKRHPAEKKPQD